MPPAALKRRWVQPSALSNRAARSTAEPSLQSGRFEMLLQHKKQKDITKENAGKCGIRYRRNTGTHWKRSSSQSTGSEVQGHPPCTYSHVLFEFCFTQEVKITQKWQIIPLLPLFLGGYLLWLSELGPRQQSSVPVQHAVTQRLQVAAARWSWKSVITKISKKQTSGLQKYLLVFPRVKFVPFNFKNCKENKTKTCFMCKHKIIRMWSHECCQAERKKESHREGWM